MKHKHLKTIQKTDIKPKPAQNKAGSGPEPEVTSELTSQAVARTAQVTPQNILRLQQTIGNQAVMRLIANQRPAPSKEKSQAVQRVGLTEEEKKNVSSARNFWQGLNKPATATTGAAKSPASTPAKDNPVASFTEQIAGLADQKGSNSYDLLSQIKTTEDEEDMGKADSGEEQEESDQGKSDSEESVGEEKSEEEHEEVKEANKDGEVEEEDDSGEGKADSEEDDSGEGKADSEEDDSGEGKADSEEGKDDSEDQSEEEDDGETADETEALNNIAQQARATANNIYMFQRQMSSHYKGEREVARGNLKESIDSTTEIIKKYYKGYEVYEKRNNPEKARECLNVATNLQKSLALQGIKVTLEGKLENEDELENRLVKYDETPEEQAKTKINIEGGKLKRSTGEPVDTRESTTFQTGMGWEIFVMSPAGDIHMNSHKIGLYHHSSLLAGAAVAAAGSIKVEDGKIQVLNDKSGHYRPTPEQMIQMLKQLKKSGVELDFTLDLAFPKVNEQASTFLNSREEYYDKRATEHIWKKFSRAYGSDKVRGVFADKGWQFNDSEKKYKKEDGSFATEQEVRDLLTAAFGEEAEPEISSPG